MVVFEKGKPKKSDYRKFKIKTVVGANDYASMKEVVRRRYTRLLEEGKPLPVKYISLLYIAHTLEQKKAFIPIISISASVFI